MGRDLMTNAVFYRAIEAIDGVVEEEAGFSAIDALRSPVTDSLFIYLFI